VTSILINLHHHADLVKRFVEKRPDHSNTTLALEEDLLGTGGTIRANSQFCGDQPTMIIHADNFSTATLSKFVDAHKNRPSDTDITMMTFYSRTPEACGIVQVDDAGIVQALHEKVKYPPGCLANGAVYIFQPKVVSEIATSRSYPLDLSVDILPKFVGRIFTWQSDGVHIDIGTHEGLRDANSS